MSNRDSIRYQVRAAHRRHAEAADGAHGIAFPSADAERDRVLRGELTRALIEERRQTGAATEADLIRHYGFTSDDLVRLGPAAVDCATARWVDRGLIEAGAS